MGQSCSTVYWCVWAENRRATKAPIDPTMYDLMKKSIAATTPQLKRQHSGQHHLLYKNQRASEAEFPPDLPKTNCPTRLIRRRSLKVMEGGEGGTHIYAIRDPENADEEDLAEEATLVAPATRQEQCPPREFSIPPPMHVLDGADVFVNSVMASNPRQEVIEWVTVSEEHSIYIADIGLTSALCDYIVTAAEQVCRGQYATYTYAKQTLGCREYPALAQASFGPVHTAVHAITEKFSSSRPLQLDDREPHIVKYDVTRKERQKLDMHTDKSEWTFLIAMSNGCGVDYDGGGTYFQCLDATIHIQRGHALIFPGKLRHCGQKIFSGLRFLLVGFLVDKSTPCGSKIIDKSSITQ